MIREQSLGTMGGIILVFLTRRLIARERCKGKARVVQSALESVGGRHERDARLDRFEAARQLTRTSKSGC